MVGLAHLVRIGWDLGCHIGLVQAHIYSQVFQLPNRREDFKRLAKRREDFSSTFASDKTFFTTPRTSSVTNIAIVANRGDD